uniref:BZIP domain-containing protein n=1 Tax=Eucampia antarctica TaxID=49252 RepID=A0A7S2R359_9STRA|mmetsp:Transcript_15241/g.14697  ORF Transcript_15241/g.14697 Transcript_15241/m.14697 type:complete len:349 (+) Transcript_15241:49-1095(+)
MHARKTRQRKKEHMQLLQNRAEGLKNEQICLKQIINEKNTASILAGMFATSHSKSSEDNTVDSKVEELLRRASDEIPDVSRIAELPALILPGQHSKRRIPGQEAEIEREIISLEHYPDDGIDYELLGKDRTKCSPGELDKIRKERNRMHAKRTRDRKRIFMEEMEDIIRQLETENNLLQNHIHGTLTNETSTNTQISQPVAVSPSNGSENSSVKEPYDVAVSSAAITANPQVKETNGNLLGDLNLSSSKSSTSVTLENDGRGSFSEAELLLALAKVTAEKRGFDRMSSTSSAVSISSGPSGQVSMQSDDYQSAYSDFSTGYPPPKKLCLKKFLYQSSKLPSSITTVQM